MSNERNAAGLGRARQRGQERALRAWEWVEQVSKEADKVQKRYGTMARKLPSYLQNSGLGQTAAFLYSKQGSAEGSAERLLLGHLDGYLRHVLGRNPVRQGDLVTLVLELSRVQYRRATRELLALAVWLKRFAEGRLGQEDD